MKAFHRINNRPWVLLVLGVGLWAWGASIDNMYPDRPNMFADIFIIAGGYMIFRSIYLGIKRLMRKMP